MMVNQAMPIQSNFVFKDCHRRSRWCYSIIYSKEYFIPIMSIVIELGTGTETRAGLQLMYLCELLYL